MRNEIPFSPSLPPALFTSLLEVRYQSVNGESPINGELVNMLPSHRRRQNQSHDVEKWEKICNAGHDIPQFHWEFFTSKQASALVRNLVFISGKLVDMKMCKNCAKTSRAVGPPG